MQTLAAESARPKYESYYMTRILFENTDCIIQLRIIIELKLLKTQRLYGKEQINMIRVRKIEPISQK